MSQWDWRKRYRVWEADRKIFAYPENWIEPDPVRRPRPRGVRVRLTGTNRAGALATAQVLASALGRDLYRIDLSAVVSRYVGETEKQLRRVFDAAEKAGAVLLFDEADAIFGKRSEVKDSHDRYANAGISYFLRRLEGYRGLAILATGGRRKLNDACLGQFDLVIRVPPRKRRRRP